MLYKFKSKASGDLIMLEANGRHVLEIIGKEGALKGIILPEQMPAAIAALQAAITQEESHDNESPDAAQHGGLGLRQRALPFIDMLQRNHKAGHEVVWGV
ncbi:MAG: DUF1840 domain-containing protein [Polaromonas sp.]|nr:DUF1840 domain-containing protein [Polaromonas sp.]MDP3355468.1 DUF1840 domain-containing protein [Polaromonas sp.]MDP3752051.1 DUF1840 domain-containing protein [Polaromonas sp.]